MALKIDVTLDRKLTCTFKNDKRNLGNFHQSMFRSLKIRILMGSFYPKQEIYELKFTVEFCVMIMKSDTKLEQELT